MRNPKRIKQIVKLLQEAWEIVPDWRLGQLIVNLLEAGYQDVFFPEDEEWERLLQKFITKHKKQCQKSR